MPTLEWPRVAGIGPHSSPALAACFVGPNDMLAGNPWKPFTSLHPIDLCFANRTCTLPLDENQHCWVAALGRSKAVTAACVAVASGRCLGCKRVEHLAGVDVAEVASCGGPKLPASEQQRRGAAASSRILSAHGCTGYLPLCRSRVTCTPSRAASPARVIKRRATRLRNVFHLAAAARVTRRPLCWPARMNPLTLKLPAELEERFWASYRVPLVIARAASGSPQRLRGPWPRGPRCAAPRWADAMKPAFFGP
jgi:hypothetical protein